MGAGALLGLLAATGLIGYYGAGPVFSAVASVGWGLGLVVLARVAAVAGAGLAWRALMSGAAPPPLAVFVGLRWIRESVNALLPVGQVGGEFVGARLLTFFGVAGGPAGAGVLVDLLLQVVTQFLFTVLGFGALVALGGDAALVRWVGVGLLAAAPALVGFFLAQRLGLVLLVERLLVGAAGRWRWAALGGVANLHDGVQAIYRDGRRVLAGAVLHMAVWFVGIAEIWLALRFMGHPVGLVEALVLESLSHAVRSAAFPIPGGLGAQEGGFVVLSGLFGFGPEIALALSLVKRVPDLVLGLPGLLAWQALESRRLLPGGGGEG